MVDVTSEVEVGAPAAEVFEFIADAANNPTWQKGMKSCVWTSDGPIADGSTYEQQASFLGRPINSTFVVTEFEAGRSITIETTESTFPIEVTRSVEPLGDDRCRVRAHVSGDASGVFKIVAPLMKLMVARSVSGDYERLQQHFAAA